MPTLPNQLDQSRPFLFPGTGSIISDGPLADICMAINHAIRTPEGETNLCILAAAAARDILLAKGYKADVLRVEATVFGDRSRPAVILGMICPDTRIAAKPGHWRGHLVAIAEGRWLLDPTLDQTGLAPPMVIEFPDWWLAGERSIEVPINDGKVRYRAAPGRGGYKSAPDFRPCRRRGIVKTVVDQLGAGDWPERSAASSFVLTSVSI
jgi:hypothetical protein